MAGEAHLVPFRTQKLSPRAPMVLRSKSVGEQDVADQQGAFLCREDLTFVGSSFLVATAFVFSTSLFEVEILRLMQFYICRKIVRYVSNHLEHQELRL